MRTVNVIICLDFDCWDFFGFALDRGVEGIKDGLVVIFSERMAKSSSLETTVSFCDILERHQEQYTLVRQKTTDQWVLIPEKLKGPLEKLLGQYGFNPSEFESSPLSISAVIRDLRDRSAWKSRFDAAKLAEIRKRKAYIESKGCSVDPAVITERQIPNYPFALVDVHDPEINQPKRVRKLFAIFDSTSKVARYVQMAGHGGNLQAITSLFLPNFHTALRELEKMRIKFLFLDSCATGCENSEHLFAQGVDPKMHARTDARNSRSQEPTSVSFPILISTIGNVTTYGTRSNAKKLFELVAALQREKYREAKSDSNNVDCIPRAITSNEWNTLMNQYEKLLDGQRELRHLMQILLPGSKFNLGTVQILNPDEAYLVISSVTLAQHKIKPYLNPPNLNHPRESQRSKLISPRHFFTPWTPLLNRQSMNLPKEANPLCVSDQIKLISLRATVVDVPLIFDAEVEQAPALFSHVPGPQHHYFKQVMASKMSMNDFFRAIHAYNQHDDAFRVLMTEKMYYFDKIKCKDQKIWGAFTYPVTNEDERAWWNLKLDRMCYQDAHGYHIRQLKEVHENINPKSIPVAFRLTYEEFQCSEFQYLLELYAALERTKQESPRRVVAAIESKDQAYHMIFNTIQSSVYGPWLTEMFARADMTRLLNQIPQHLNQWAKDLTTHQASQLKILSRRKGEQESAAVRGLLEEGLQPQVHRVEVGRPPSPTRAASAGQMK